MRKPLAITVLIVVVLTATYFIFKNFQSQNENVNNTTPSYVGVGLNIFPNDSVVVPIPGSPADKAGIQNGDLLLAINGVDISTSTIGLIDNMLRGDIGTNVTVTVSRIGAQSPLTFSMSRSLISTSSMDIYSIPENSNGLGLSFYYRDNPNLPVFLYVDPEGLAYQLGIKDGDILLSANRVSVVSLSPQEIVNMLRGRTEDILVISRLGFDNPLTFTLDPAFSTPIPQWNSSCVPPVVTDSTTTPSIKKFTDNDIGVSFYYPSTWQVSADCSGINIVPNPQPLTGEGTYFTFTEVETSSTTDMDTSHVSDGLEEAVSYWFNANSNQWMTSGTLSKGFMSPLRESYNFIKPGIATTSYYTDSGIPIFFGITDYRILPLSHDKFLYVSFPLGDPLSPSDELSQQMETLVKSISVL